MKKPGTNGPLQSGSLTAAGSPEMPSFRCSWPLATEERKSKRGGSSVAPHRAMPEARSARGERSGSIVGGDAMRDTYEAFHRQMEDELTWQ